MELVSNLISLIWSLMIIRGSYGYIAGHNCSQQYEDICPNMTHYDQLQCVSKLHYDLINRKEVHVGCRLEALAEIQSLNLLSEESIDSLKFNQPKSICKSLSQANSLWSKIRLHKDTNQIDYSKAMETIDFTLVTQCSVTRLWMISLICKRWKGNIVVVVTGVNTDRLPSPPSCSAGISIQQNKKTSSSKLQEFTSNLVNVGKETRHREFEARSLKMKRMNREIQSRQRTQHHVEDEHRQLRIEESDNEKDNDETGRYVAGHRRRRTLTGYMKKYQNRKVLPFDSNASTTTSMDVISKRKSIKKKKYGLFSESSSSSSAWSGLSRSSVDSPLLNNNDVITSVKSNNTTSMLHNTRTVEIISYPDVEISELFPINKLRNFVLCHVKTTHALYIDVDFWPSVQLYEHLHQIMRQEIEPFTDLLHGIVIPAFQVKSKEAMNCSPDRRRSCYERVVPKDPIGLKVCRQRGHCSVFDEMGNPEGHASTNYSAWDTQTKLRSLDCFRSDRYEPYLVLPVSPLTPLFEEEFRGYGKNKIQHVMHLQARGFQFSVLPQEFLVHVPHRLSEARRIWTISSSLSSSSLTTFGKNNKFAEKKLTQRSMNDKVFSKYMHWLYINYKDMDNNENSLNHYDDYHKVVENSNKYQGNEIENFENDLKIFQYKILMFNILHSEHYLKNENIINYYKYMRIPICRNITFSNVTNITQNFEFLTKNKPIIVQ